jgi:3-deoxy-manno-octulosonate cytidylyltransferase (CMP-KDO synthetase)
MNDPKCIAIIPARFASTRFPGKPLASIAGKPMIQHVYERVLKASRVGEVIVATDDARIYNAVVQFGGKAAMTSSAHLSGTDRVAEVALNSDAEIIVNVQGDEPLIESQCLDAAVAPLDADSELLISTLKSAAGATEEYSNPNVVKVVTDQNDFALYFSRAPIPFYEQGLRPKREGSPLFFKHIGIYVYRRRFLELLPLLKPSVLEKVESLEQLRFLENGYRIKVVRYDYESHAVDTPEDLEQVRQLWNS